MRKQEGAEAGGLGKRQHLDSRSRLRAFFEAALSARLLRVPGPPCACFPPGTAAPEDGRTPRAARRHVPFKPLEGGKRIDTRMRLGSLDQ